MLFRSVQHAEKARKADPDSILAYFLQAEALRELERLENARAALDEAADRAGEDPGHLYRLGVLYMSVEGNEGALDAFNRAAELGMESRYLYFNRAVTHQRLGHSDKAREDACLAAEIGEDFSQATQLCEQLQ